MERFLGSIDFDLAQPGEPSIAISDANDQPILDAAVAATVDLLVTGDMAFLALAIDVPRIVTARQFVDEFGSQACS